MFLCTCGGGSVRLRTGTGAGGAVSDGCSKLREPGPTIYRHMSVFEGVERFLAGGVWSLQLVVKVESVVLSRGGR